MCMLAMAYVEVCGKTLLCVLCVCACTYIIPLHIETSFPIHSQFSEFPSTITSANHTPQKAEWGPRPRKAKEVTFALSSHTPKGLVS